MVNLLQSGWMASLVGALLYFGITLAIFPSSKELQPPPVEVEAPAKKPFSWDSSNSELEELVADLKKERALLTLRETQLNDLEARLKIERQEINQTTNFVNQLQKEFDANVTRVKEDETQNLKKLAKVYSTMSPDAASLILKQLEDASLVKILMFMKEAEVAPILESLAKPGETEAARVAGLSERLRLSIQAKPNKTTP